MKMKENLSMKKIAIILGSVRDGRNAPQVGEWVKEVAEAHGNAEYSIIDLKDYNMPLFYKRFSEYDGSEEEYSRLKELQEKTIEADGYVFITQEYNHSITSALKNYLDLYYAEFNNKSAGIVSYGSFMGGRAAEHLRGILSELQVAHVRNHVGLSLFTDFEGFVNFKPQAMHADGVKALLDQVVNWSEALSTLR